MADRQIDRQVLRQMIEAGETYQAIATHFRVSVGGVQQAVEAIGLQKKTLSHKKYVPWTVLREHSQTGPITALRNLSKVVQGQSIPLAKLNTALRWATRLDEANLDIDYDRDKGFFEKPADGDSHIGMVLAEVRVALQNNK
ncbi:hypothetical protein [Nonomuraea sp. NPDC049129]|uniref:hypothetical protein n=1 Tax=Nonomuraea sp. NPDC049129 TaxID=3155272 RepID=UPI0033D02CD1